MKNLRELSIEELKSAAIGILDFVHNICVENDIPYSLDAGTLLGAIRHKGFIPWDDDIDIFIKRSEYERFIKIMSKDNNGRYRLLSRNTCNDYIYSFAKVVDSQTILIEDMVKPIKGMGVYLDVFPMDNLPDDEKCCFKHQKKMRFLRNVACYLAYDKEYVKSKSILFKIKYYVSKIIGINNERALEQIERLAKKFNDTKCIFVSHIVAATNPYMKASSEILRNRILWDFEGKKYYVTSEYNKYLTSLYRDYMQLPPEEKRVSNHNFKAYFKAEYEN